MLKQSLSQKMLQKLSPQQIQLMKLLQIPTAILEQRIKEELEVNPALDEGEEHDDHLETENQENEYSDEPIYNEGEGDFDTDNDFEEPYREETFELDDYISDYIEDDPATYKLRGDSNMPEEEDKNIPIAVENSFYEHLERQLGLLNLKDEREDLIALQIIGSIDEDGYLRRDPASIIDDLMFSQNILASESEVIKLLSFIQKFDPPGVGARDLQECLLIQVDQKLNSEEIDDNDYNILKTAREIIFKHFDKFSKKHYQKLQKQLGISDKCFKNAIEVILKLNPKPASAHISGAQKINQYIVPDFIIHNRDGELELSLNSKNAPDLRINDHYKDMLISYKQSAKVKKIERREKEAVLFIKQKIDAAKWFIDAIKQRQQTMYKTMYAIMQYQYDFFLSGDQRKFRPMILKDIADITGLDISTVSRVANSKFVQTEFGTKRLKDFFSESLQNQDGEEVSTLEVKKILSDIIQNENKRRPLSDERLKDMLTEKGYNIARRTVAKYREQLNIPVARLRKGL